jgi:hypothetical protein
MLIQVMLLVDVWPGEITLGWELEWAEDDD